MVAETLITHTLRDDWRDEGLQPDVRTFLRRHYLDEARHSAYFSRLLTLLWPQWPAGVRDALRPLWSGLIDAFLFADARIAARWFAWPNLLFFSPVPVLTAALAWLAARSLRRGGEALPFVASIGLFFLAFSGLTISLWPHVAPPSITLWSAASASASQEFLMIGTAFMLPVLLFYVCWSYWVFRGKVRGDVGYEHM